MEVKLTSDLRARLTRLAAEQGRDAESLVREALERLIDEEGWFLREVEIGLEAADRGDVIDHAQARAMVESRYPG